MTVPPLYYNNDKRSFGFSTARSRWPKILLTAIEDVKIELNNKPNDLKTKQAQTIIKSIKKLSNNIVNNASINKFNNDTIAGLNSYDDTLSKLEADNGNKPLTWLTGPWLYTECYLYRQLDSFFKSNSEWLQFDIFNRLKRDTFFSSTLGVYELIIRYKQLSLQKEEIENNEDLLKILYEEFIDVSLWGNATDLSLLANATLDDIKSVQGKEAREKSKKNIIANDLDKSWERLIDVSTKEKRVDFVLDNSGFEFFTDLCLALFLLDFKLVDKIVVHCKTRPWMVSDTMIKDVKIILKDLLDETHFPEHQSEIQFFVNAVEKYQKLGKFEAVDSEFWTVDLDYWNLAQTETKYGGAELWKYFQDSTLVIVKGDLNYRKLTGDRHWPRDTPFVTAIDKLSNSGIHLLALRTCKADVCAGLAPGKDEELSKYWESQGNEIGELWCSSGKWAVISYSDGSN